MEITPHTLNFIKAHAQDDVRKLALSAPRNGDIDLPFALDQIRGRQIARQKLPSWAAIEGIIFPPHISMEQCSSEQTARYKACVAERFVEKEHSCLIDMTGGFGVDFSYLAQGFGRCVYVERQEHLCEIARHNLPLLGLGNAKVICGDGEEWMKGQSEVSNTSHKTQEKTDYSPSSLQSLQSSSPSSLQSLQSSSPSSLQSSLPLSPSNVTTPSPSGEGKGRGAEGSGLGLFIFLDPARRDSHGNRTYAIGDCTPDVLSFIDELTEKAAAVMIKLSPMLDWHATVEDINRAVTGGDAVREVHIISTGNECKELLIVVSKKCKIPLKVYCVNKAPSAPLPLPSPEGEGVDRNEGDGGCSSEESPQDISSSFEVFSFIPSASSSNVTTPSPSRGGLGRGAGCVLLVPNSSIMKAGCFTQVGQEFNLSELSCNSHIFVSDRNIPDFPGKCYKIIATSTMNKKELRKALQGIEQANISTRNFPMSPDQLRKRLKLRDGGDIYIFATTTKEKEHVLYVTKKCERSETNQALL